MRTFFLAALALVLVATTCAVAFHVDDSLLAEGRPALSASLLDEVLAKNNGEWEASLDNGKKFDGLTLGQARMLMGTRDISNKELSPRVFTEEEMLKAVPENFDSAENWPQCSTISEIRDQSNCGSCWAIAAAGAISDRYCTVANQTDVRISTANLLSCCFVCGMGCNGGWPTMAWMWWTWSGLTTESCQPYPFGPCGHHSEEGRYPPCPDTIYETPTCNATCLDSKTQMTMYKGASSYAVSGEEAYQRELMEKGPFEVAFTVYEDFLLYKSGVYSYTAGQQLGGHAVRIVGWGELNGTKYWKIANSWNVDWGDNGYFLIKRGGDECGIESSGVAGVPEVSN